ncbi:MAG: hypothetical protein ABIR28_11985 [Vicinamibacteria bacterium]
MNPQPLGQQRLDYRSACHLDSNGNLIALHVSLDHESNQGL